MAPREPNKNDDEKRGPDESPIGLGPDGQINVVPADQVEAQLAEIRRMREEEGYTPTEGGDDDE